MGEKLSKACNGWLGWALIGVLGVGYFIAHLIAEDDDRAEARAEKIGAEMRDRVGADLRAKSAARHAKMMDEIKSGALFKPVPTPPASARPPSAGQSATPAKVAPE